MVSEQRQGLDDLVVKMRAGRLTRRTFLERAIVLGLGTSAAVSLLEACGSGASSGGPVTISWESEHDDSGVYQKLVDSFNSTNTSKIHVNFTNGPNDTGQLRTVVVSALRARSDSRDVFSMDIIWPAEFASNGWTVPLDSMWSSSERDKYLPGPIQGCSFNGKVYAAPLRTDAGLLYYRKDLVPSAPNTYDDMTNVANQVLAKKSTKFGYVWQAAQYEGLVCNFIEVLSGYGGSVLDKSDPKKVTVNSAEARAAVTRMASWVGGISPQAVTTFREEDCRTAFQNGDAAFMRNWPYAYSLGNDPTKSKVANKFNVHSLPYGGSNTTGHSNLGGWQLGINAFSKHQDAAWEFVKFMLSPSAQKQIAIDASLFATLKSVYTDSEVLSKHPFFGNVGPIFQNAVPRPVSPKYPDITTAIQLRIHQALTKEKSPADALSALESDLKTIVK